MQYRVLMNCMLSFIIINFPCNTFLCQLLQKDLEISEYVPEFCKHFCWSHDQQILCQVSRSR